MISIDEFAKVEIKIGTILSAEPVEGSDKLLKLSVDFGLKPAAPIEVIQENVEVVTGEKTSGEEPVIVEDVKDVRTVVSGIAKYVEVETLPGKQFSFVTNLEPRAIMGIESQAMIMAAKDGEDFAILTPSKAISSGTSVS